MLAYQVMVRVFTVYAWTIAMKTTYVDEDCEGNDLVQSDVESGGMVAETSSVELNIVKPKTVSHQSPKKKRP